MGKKKHKRVDGVQNPKPMRLVPGDAPVLHGVALPELPMDDWWLLGRRMVATCLKYNGMAVAAPQVGVNIRLVALRDGTVVLNPTIVSQSGMQSGAEGCLSYPGRWFMVERPRLVHVVGVHPGDGSGISLKAEDIDARCWAHEIDHLDGLVLVNRFPEIVDGSVGAQHLR